jgi:hypothetical protein
MGANVAQDDGAAAREYCVRRNALENSFPKKKVENVCFIQYNINNILKQITQGRSSSWQQKELHCT